MQMWLYILSQPQCWPYEIAIIFMIICLIWTIRNPCPWKWRCLFCFEVLTGAVSLVLALYYGNLSFNYIGEFACAGIGTIGSLLMTVITFFKWRAQNTET